jgi:hypothetical protein
MKALSFSRGRLAADLGVDKSVVARWATGAVSPSEHNLVALTALIAGRKPGFSMLDWDRDPEQLVALFGGESLAGGTGRPGTAKSLDILGPLLEQSRLTTDRRGSAYEGFWRSTRPSVIMEGRFFHDHGMIRREADGLLQFSVGGSGLLFKGWVLLNEGQLFIVLYDTVGLTPIFLIFNGVPLQKASLIDGIVMASALNAARTPSAYPIILERIGDLSGDREVDDARCQELLARDPLAPEGEVPEHIQKHLVRDVGPHAVAQGLGDLFLLAPVTTTLSRGASAGGHLTG